MEFIMDLIIEMFFGFVVVFLGAGLILIGISVMGTSIPFAVMCFILGLAAVVVGIIMGVCSYFSS